MTRIDGRELRVAHRARADVVIVGSGPGGATVARAVARSGATVIVVEEGHWLAPEDAAPDGLGAMARYYRGLGATITLGKPSMPYVQGRAVGGTSVVNGAICWRLPRDVHQRWIEADPALADALPWADLEAITDEIERDLNIHPTPPEIAGANNLLLAKGAEALGLAHRPIARNVRGCRGLGRCLQACPEGHKLSMDRSYLLDAETAGATILSGARVDRVITRSGRATGVAGRSAAGATFEIEARHAVVLAASAVQTPVLLLRSNIDDGPVGHGFQCHPGASMAGYFDEPVRMWTGATQGHEVTGLRHEGLKFEALGYDMAIVATRLKGVGRALSRDIAELDHWANWGCALRASARGRVRNLAGRPMIRFGLTRDDVLRLRRGVRVLGEMMLAAGARYVTPGVFGFAERVEDRKQMAAFEETGPLDANAYAMAVTHMFGTARMGSDPASSVVRPDFRHHRVAGLYVADSSVFPTNTGVNPQTSIVALATLCARHVSAAIAGGPSGRGPSGADRTARS